MKGRPIVVVFLLLLCVQCVSYSLPPQEPLSAQQLLENLKKREFMGAILDLDFDNIDLNRIFQRFEIISGLNFVVDPNINVVRKFTFKGIEWDKALHLVLLSLELELQMDGGTLRLIKARPWSSRLSISFLAGVFSTILLVVLVFIYSVKKRAKAIQQDKKYPLSEDRVEEVKKRLGDSLDRDKTILEIAFSAGFNTKSSFNKTFKILTGKTPRDYRARNGTNAP